MSGAEAKLARPFEAEKFNRLAWSSMAVTCRE